MKNRTVYVVLAIAFIVGLSVAYWWYTAYRPAELFRAARQSSASLDFQQAAENYRTLSESAGSSDDRTRYRIREGFSDNRGGNFATGIPILKDVISDPAVPNYLKVEALVAMTNIYYRYRWREPLQMIFSDGGMYANALGEGSIDKLADLENALEKLYGTANETYETSYVHYMLAVAAASRVLDRPGLPEDTMTKEIGSIRSHIQRGDSLYRLEFDRGLYTSSSLSIFNVFRISMRHFRLFSLEVVARYDLSYRKTVEETYQRVILDSSQWPSTVEAYMRFYYAAYLIDVYGSSRSDEVKSIMWPIMEETGSWGESNRLSMWVFLDRELNRPVSEQGHNKRFILSIAAADPEFKEFLIKKGFLKTGQ